MQDIERGLGIDFFFLHGWSFLLACLPYIGGAITLYIVSATVFLLTAKIEKDDEGSILLDPESWHFKASYPFARFDSWQMSKISARMGLCSYFSRFFLMTYLGWPMLFMWCFLKTLVYGPFMFLFGLYSVASLESMRCGRPFDVKANRVAKLPTIKGYPIFPVYIIGLVLYGLSWYFYPDTTLGRTVVISFFLGIIACGFGIYYFYGFLSKKISKRELDGRPSRTSLVTEWIGAKTSRLCPRVRIKGVHYYHYH